MKYIIIFVNICFVFIMVWCTSSTIADPTQTISFLNYHLQIWTWYQLWDKNAVIDSRISKKVIAIYNTSSSVLWFSDNIIISQDTLTPRASLEDYVQSSIGGIAYTWWQYKSIGFEKWTINCNNTNIPTIMNTFSIYRTPLNSSPETLYFAQYFIHNKEQIIILSSSTNEQDKLTSLKTMLSTLGCSSS